jgi:hypothetical protein
MSDAVAHRIGVDVGLGSSMELTSSLGLEYEQSDCHYLHCGQKLPEEVEVGPVVVGRKKSC